MRMLSLALSAACLFAASGCAQAPPQEAATGAQQAQSDNKKQICMEQDAGPSSRLGSTRVCHTQEEWDKLQVKKR
jgi:hypothetical protein